MRRAALAWVAAAAAQPRIEFAELPPVEAAEGWRDWQKLGVRGLHVGSGLSLPPGCLNTDVEGIGTDGAVTSLEAPFVAVRVSGAAAARARRCLRRRVAGRVDVERDRPAPAGAGRFRRVRGRLGEGIPSKPPNTGEPTRYFLQHDATTRFPVADASFDYVFAEHFVEHVSRGAGVRFLIEARRVLRRSGGVVRLSTPDLARYVAAYFRRADIP